MRLATRIATTMGLLVAGTVAASGYAGLRVTRQRLDLEINRSIDLVAAPVGRSVEFSRGQCGLAPSRTERDDKRPKPTGGDPKGPGSARVPRGLVVQCLDTSGAVMATSPSSAIPTSSQARALATSGQSGTRREEHATIDDEKHRVVTIAVPTLGAVQVARPVGERDRVLRSLLQRFGMIALTSGMAAIAIGVLLARRISRPLRDLNDTAAQIADTGVLSSLAAKSASSTTEVDELAHSFRSMLSTLQQSQDAQARLVQDAGHELRTPITSLRMNVSMLARPSVAEEKRAAILADVQSELRELTMVTNELIAAAAPNSSAESIGAVDVCSVVRGAARRWERRTGRPITTTITTTNTTTTNTPTTNTSTNTDGITNEATAAVDIGTIAIRRVVDNLLSNAEKFSAAGSAIEIDVIGLASQVVIQVRDYGQGIDNADLGRVFDRFYRSDQARSVTGSGLGLSIVRDIVESAGGSASVRNADGGGALFRVTFPRSQSAVRANDV